MVHNGRPLTRVTGNRYSFSGGHLRRFDKKTTRRFEVAGKARRNHPVAAEHHQGHQEGDLQRPVLLNRAENCDCVLPARERSAHRRVTSLDIFHGGEDRYRAVLAATRAAVQLEDSPDLPCIPVRDRLADSGPLGYARVGRGKHPRRHGEEKQTSFKGCASSHGERKAAVGHAAIFFPNHCQLLLTRVDGL